MNQGSLEAFQGRTLHFKHVYGTAVDAWGVVGFPKSQPAGTAGRKYRLGDPVLLAIPRETDPVVGEVPEAVRGKIFAVCTLVVIAGTARRENANTEMVRRYPDVVNRWDTALPILRAWKFDEPRDYTTFGGHRELVRGHCSW